MADLIKKPLIHRFQKLPFCGKPPHVDSGVTGIVSLKSPRIGISRDLDLDSPFPPI
jgi:hypothetical protein